MSHPPPTRRRPPLAHRLLAASLTLGVGFITGLTRVPVPTVVAMPPRPDGTVAAWPRADGPGGTHYSPLAEVTASNVRDLRKAWAHRTGDVASSGERQAGTAFEATPIMVDGLLYVSTPFSRALALDAETGEESWSFDPGSDRTDTTTPWSPPEDFRPGGIPKTWAWARADPASSLASFDARLFALDAGSGRPCSDFGRDGMVDLGRGVPRISGRRAQYKQTAPPTLVGGLVVAGSSILDSRDADAPSGIIRAFDARTGEERWRWDPLAGVGGVDGRLLRAGGGGKHLGDHDRRRGAGPPLRAHRKSEPGSLRGPEART